MRRDERGIIISWLVKIIVMLAILGLVLFEAGAIIVATVGVDGTADVAAREAALEYGRQENLDAARKVATDKAKEGGGTLIDIKVASDGKWVVVTVERKAQTWLAQRIGPLKRFTNPRSTRQALIR